MHLIWCPFWGYLTRPQKGHDIDAACFRLKLFRTMPPNKGILAKGSHGAGKGAASKKPSTKVMKVKKLSLKKGHLEKLHKMTLAQKVQKAAEGCETAPEPATNLRGMLTKEERSKVWSKRNVALKKKPAKEQKAFDSLTKGEKGMEAAMYMVKASVPQFMQVKEPVGQDQTLDKREEWQSEMGKMNLKDMFSQGACSGERTHGHGESTITKTRAT